jgi:acyl transferase domain-containing protein
MVACAKNSLQEETKKIVIRAPKFPVWTNTTAKPYSTNVDDIRTQFALQPTVPVRFMQEIEAMYKDGVRFFVEVGPGRVLTQLVQKILNGKPHLAISCDEPGQPSILTLLTTIARLAVHQVKLNTEAIFADIGTIPFDIDKQTKRPVRVFTNNTVPCSTVRTTLQRGVQGAEFLEYFHTTQELIRTQRDMMFQRL